MLRHRERAGDEGVYAAFNASDRAASVSIPLRPGEAGQWRDALGLCPPPALRDGNLVAQLPARGAAWYVRA